MLLDEFEAPVYVPELRGMPAEVPRPIIFIFRALEALADLRLYRIKLAHAVCLKLDHVQGSSDGLELLHRVIRTTCKLLTTVAVVEVYEHERIHSTRRTEGRVKRVPKRGVGLAKVSKLARYAHGGFKLGGFDTRGWD